MANRSAIRYGFLAIWLLVAIAALYLYFFHRAFLQTRLDTALSATAMAAGVLYLVLWSVRPFTLIPPTFLLFAAIPFFSPILLLSLTLVGIAISSSIFYWFSEVLHLDEAFERRYPEHIGRMKATLQRHELPIIIGWSFFLFLPTDVLCYVCGTLRIDFKKFLFGVVVGEGTVFGIYIFLGQYVIHLLPFGL
jgi:uncharacterized membrane protein YdjX (TVP38/TMEM64 family)